MIYKIKKKLERLKGERSAVKRNVLKRRANLKALRKEALHVEEAQTIIQTEAENTQNQLVYDITELSSLSLDYVFDNPYKLWMEFVQKRRKTECNLKYERGGNLYAPDKEVSHGACNIGAFGMRASLLKLKVRKVRNFLLIDEPFPGLKGREANLRALEMIQQICAESDPPLQVIMIGDERVSEKDISEIADKTFMTTIKNGVSKMKEV